MRWGLVMAVLAALALPATAQAWPTWGNLESGDCAYAAAANWELLHGGTTASDAQVLAEYRAVSPGDEGISGDQLETIWRTHGIAGRKINVHGSGDTTLPALRRTMRRGGTPIVEMAVEPGQRWGTVQDAPGGIHFAVVRYITRRGPVLLTWGQLAQMTWWQWSEDALLLYA